MQNKNDRPEPIVETPEGAGEPLRRLAGDRVDGDALSQGLDARSQDETQRLLDQLRVHQIELELRNDELRQTQALLDVERLRYFELYDLAPVGYCTLSDTGMVVEANLAAAALLGVGRQELAGQPLTRFVFPADQDVYDLHRKKLLATGEPQECELRLVKTDAVEFWAKLMSKPDPPRAGQPRALDGARTSRVVLSDITERVQARAKLEASETRYRRLFETAKDGILILDADTGKVVDANPFLTVLTGYSHDNFLDKYLWEVGPFKDVAASKDSFAELQAKEFIRYEHLPLDAFDGRKIAVEFISNVYWVDGRKVIQCNIRDMTERTRTDQERLRLEAQLQQAQKMESVGRLAGGVAHDFNNMLCVILGHVDLAMAQVDAGEPLHADLGEIKSAAERSANLTRQLLAFARKQVIAPKVLDLNEAVESMLKMLRRLIGEDISLVWVPDPGLWPVKIDPAQIDQILANLCVNARDAISGVGKVSIETENRTFDADDCAANVEVTAGEYVRLAISDDGCGMDKATQQKLFEPFFTTKAVGLGTGLGLATVYGIVKQNKGFLNVCSEPSRGTTFTVYLPRHLPKTEHVRAEVPEGPILRGHETILLVEDEPAILRVATKMLERQGYTVLAAGSPADAIRWAGERGGEIHLLVTDVVMPEMNGRDLARKVLGLHPAIKRLFMSGYTSGVIGRQGTIDEGMHFIQKPFSARELATKVREALDQEWVADAE
jgi:PAS domain S-box-containing protein